jgi:hypothetical protein
MTSGTASFVSPSRRALIVMAITPPRAERGGEVAGPVSAQVKDALGELHDQNVERADRDHLSREEQEQQSRMSIATNERERASVASIVLVGGVGRRHRHDAEIRERQHEHGPDQAAGGREGEHRSSGVQGKQPPLPRPGPRAG